MSVLWILVALAFFFAVLALVVYALFELSPFARHSEALRDAFAGRRTGESPHLETRDEFEHTHPA